MRLTMPRPQPILMDRLPLIVIIAFRAGIVEALSYRGDAIERLEAVGADAGLSYSHG
jgi:hypothetical protein